MLGACSTGGEPVVATNSAVTTSAMPTHPSQPSTRRTDSLVMPDLRGLYWSTAEPALRTIGWTGVLSKASDVTNSQYRPNQIAEQVPGPGQVIASDAVITLQFAA